MDICDRMGRHAPGELLAVDDRVPDDVGEVLVQGTPAGHVENLHAATDGENGELAGIGRAHELEFEGIQLRLGGADPVVSLRSVALRVDVGAARQAHTVGMCQHRGQARGRHRRRHTGAPPAASIACR